MMYRANDIKCHICGALNVVAGEVHGVYYCEVHTPTLTTAAPANEQFITGSQRDNPTGKPRYDLIPTEWLDSLAERLEFGAKAYGEDNWRLGQPIQRLIASAMRHLVQFRDGDESENHAGAVAWNLLAAQWTLKEIKAGRLPEALDTRWLTDRSSR